MALQDDTTNEFSNMAYAADTSAAMANQPSLLEGVGNFATKFVPLTGLSIVNSFLNTPIEIANYFGANIEPFKAEQQLKNLGWDDYANYYNSHQQGIEAAGLITGSLIPGMAGVKLMRAAQGGAFGSMLARSLNLGMPITKDIIEAATTNILDKGSLYNSYRSQLLYAIGTGVRDNVLEGLAYEVGMQATMHANPVLDGESYDNILYDTLWSAALGGGIGGGLGAISTTAKFRKANLMADLTSKQFEQQFNSGLRSGSTFADYGMGDESFGILKQLQKIVTETPTTEIGRMKQSTTYTNMKNKFLQTLDDGFTYSDKSNAEHVKAFGNMLLSDVENGSFNIEDKADYLVRLHNIGVINTEPVVPTTDITFVNKFVTPESKLALGRRQPFVTDILTNAPHDAADITRAFQMDPFSQKIEIMSALDTFVDGNGQRVPPAQSAKEAWNLGADIWINKFGGVSINPNAPNLLEVPLPGFTRIMSEKEFKEFKRTGRMLDGGKPITGAPMTVNVNPNSGNYGAITEGATAVPGDLGGVSVEADRVAYGIKANRTVDYEAAANPLDTQTPTLTAAARYLWANKNGLRNAADVTETDIPMMEAILKGGQKFGGGWQNWTKFLENRGIQLDFDTMPQNVIDMKYLLMDRKEAFIKQLLKENPNMGMDEVGIRANVHPDYVENVFRATKDADFMPDSERFGQVNHVQTEYNVGNINRANGEIIRGTLDAQKRQDIVLNQLRSNAASFFGPAFESFLTRFTSKDATIEGAGPGMFTFANAQYGTLAETAERIGRQVDQFVKEMNKNDLMKLSPLARAIRDDPEAARELGFFTFIRRSNAESFSFLTPDLQQKYLPNMAAGNRIAVLTSSLVKDKSGAVVDWNQNLMPPGFTQGLLKAEAGPSPAGYRNFYELSNKVASFELAQSEINNARIAARNKWYQANGLSRELPMDVLYAPPVDTAKYPNVALIKPKPGTAFADDGVAIISAENAQELASKMSAIDKGQFEVYTKDQIADFRRLQGDYEASRNFNTGLANSEMKRNGVFSNFIPDVNAETILKDFEDHNIRQNMRLVRDHVESANSQLFAELEDMGKQFIGPATSTTNWFSSLFAKGAENPYRDIQNVMLNIAKQGSGPLYTFWHDSNEMLDAYASRAVRTIRGQFISAKVTDQDYAAASAMAERMGLGNPWSKMVDGLQAFRDTASQLPPTRILSRIVSAINTVQAATAIRLDTMQSLINVISTPILMATELASVRKAMEIQFPGGPRIPGTIRLIAQGINDWFDPAIRGTRIQMMQEQGIIKSVVNDYFKLQDQMSVPFGEAFNENKYFNWLRDMTDTGAKLTLSNYSESFVRGVTGLVAMRAFEAVGYTGQDLLDHVMTFVNRTHGNIVASQRPIAFQGPLGHAATLFQTYQMNLLQNVMRYIGNGEAKTLATFLGLQGTMFGVQGLPGMQLVNQYLVGNLRDNPMHKDIYSTTENALDKNLSDWVLYGAGSNVLRMGLYNRGDLTPRTPTVIPLDPKEFPAVSGAVNFFSQLYNTTNKLMQGGELWNTFTQGLEHNGMSRPLSGLAQLMQGYNTTAGGKLVSAIRGGPPADSNNGTMGWVDVMDSFWAGAGRLAGVRPLEEAITLDAAYRRTMYQANDSAKLKELGAAARTYFTGGGSMPPEVINQFAARYAASGGYAPRFASEIVNWARDANVSIGNSVFRNLGNPINQQMFMQMGGVPLPDYTIPANMNTPNAGTLSSMTTSGVARMRQNLLFGNGP